MQRFSLWYSLTRFDTAYLILIAGALVFTLVTFLPVVDSPESVVQILFYGLVIAAIFINGVVLWRMRGHRRRSAAVLAIVVAGTFFWLWIHAPYTQLGPFESISIAHDALSSSWTGRTLAGDRSFMVTMMYCYLAFGALLFWLLPYSKRQTPIATPETLTPHDAAFSDLLEGLSKRNRLVLLTLENLITETKRRAHLVLLMILALLVSGVLVISFAGQITTLDLIAGSSTTLIENERAAKRTDRNAIRDTLQDLQDQQIDARIVLERAGYSTTMTQDGVLTYQREANINTLLSTGEDDFVKLLTALESTDAYTSYAGRSATSLPRSTRATDEKPDDAGASPPTSTEILRFFNDLTTQVQRRNFAIATVLKEIAEIDTRLSDISTMIDDDTRARITSMSNSSGQNPSFLIASGITRFGIVAIIVYIIQILVSLYRYNMRLASFYVARKKALVIGSADARDIDYFATYFDASAITFGKESTSPVADISGVIRKGFEEAGKAWVTTKGKVAGSV